MSEKTYWNGEPATAVRGSGVVVGSPEFPMSWTHEVDGDRIAVVQVEYNGDVFWLDDRNSYGWRKVTEGRGSPRYGSRSLRPADWHPECDAADCLECHILRLKREHGEPLSGLRCGELLPEHLQAPFWRRQVERYVRKEGLDPNSDDLPAALAATPGDSNE